MIMVTGDLNRNHDQCDNDASLGLDEDEDEEKESFKEGNSERLVHSGQSNGCKGY